jgi:rfaE bifunctional protein kinase chain/domain
MDFEISREKIAYLLQSFSSRKIGVIGDFTMDGYWHADMRRSQLSRETPLFSRPVYRESYSPGGAANVAWNLADLKPAAVWAFTVFGEDWRGELFRQVLKKAGIRLEEVITQSKWMTPFYGKVMLVGDNSQQEDPRIDFVNTEPLSAETEVQLIARIQDRLPDLDALVVADYQSIGVVTPEIIRALNHMASANDKLLFVVDSRERIANFNRMVIKPNDIEAGRGFFPGRNASSISVDELGKAGIEWQKTNGCPVFITLGSRGCLVCNQGKVNLIPAIRVPPPIDTVGAGDTFLASLTAGLVGGATPEEAASLATLATAVTIRKLRITGTASPEEILEQYDNLSHE